METDSVVAGLIDDGHTGHLNAPGFLIVCHVDDEHDGDFNAPDLAIVVLIDDGQKYHIKA